MATLAKELLDIIFVLSDFEVDGFDDVLFNGVLEGFHRCVAARLEGLEFICFLNRRVRFEVEFESGGDGDLVLFAYPQEFILLRSF